MGMTTECTICGKHYKSCKHYLKEHIAYSAHNCIALCGRKDVVLLHDGWEECDIDPNDVCKLCAKLDNYFQARFELKNGQYIEREDKEIFIFGEDL